MIYDKSLKLSTWSLTSGDMTQGQMVNYIAVDSYNLMYLFYFFNYCWAVPIQVSMTAFSGFQTFLLFLKSSVPLLLNLCANLLLLFVSILDYVQIYDKRKRKCFKNVIKGDKKASGKMPTKISE